MSSAGRETKQRAIDACLQRISSERLDPLDLVDRANFAEKLIELCLSGPPPGPARATAGLQELAACLKDLDTSAVKVVVLGGGSGLSNLVGGDSRTPEWHRQPFQGLKALFPRTRAVVCVTDDGGSTGELLKDLPLIALGDLRHVLLSCVRRQKLREQYALDHEGALRTAATLQTLFNYRFTAAPASAAELLAATGIGPESLPDPMHRHLWSLLEALFQDKRLHGLLHRPHCLGNLLLVASIYQQVETGLEVEDAALLKGIHFLADLIGVTPGAVLPCTTTPAQLKIKYSNGVVVGGEFKSASARRKYPVERVFVEFAREPQVPPAVLEAISSAEIILFAPGSLYTSIVPILQVPGLARAVRENRQALKILVANLWVQKGETDLVRENPGRRFYVSDLIRAYHHNIPGGVRDLFSQVLVLGYQDIPGSVLQNYAVENKVPIFLDREQVKHLGFAPVESRVYSESALQHRRVIQHDPASLAEAVHTLWAIRRHLPVQQVNGLPPCFRMERPLIRTRSNPPSRRLTQMRARLAELSIQEELREPILDILWQHCDIRLSHLDLVAGVRLVDRRSWRRSQEWDRVYSFYDPADRYIKIRRDVAAQPERFEVAFLVALGQSLLGDYALRKEMIPIEQDGELLGRTYQLLLREPAARHCYFREAELETCLWLARMNRSPRNSLKYTRLLNGTETFTPPGLLFGLTYAWYLDNRFAAHVEYKMGILQTELSDLIPAQIKMSERRRICVDFYRRVVFRYDDPLFEEAGGDGRRGQDV